MVAVAPEIPIQLELILAIPGELPLYQSAAPIGRNPPAAYERASGVSFDRLAGARGLAPEKIKALEASGLEWRVSFAEQPERVRYVSIWSGAVMAYVEGFEFGREFVVELFDSRERWTVATIRGTRLECVLAVWNLGEAVRQ